MKQYETELLVPVPSDSTPIERILDDVAAAVDLSSDKPAHVKVNGQFIAAMAQAGLGSQFGQSRRYKGVKFKP